MYNYILKYMILSKLFWQNLRKGCLNELSIIFQFFGKDVVHVHLWGKKRIRVFMFKQVDELSLLDNELAILRAGLP